mgnify:CR=1 FL=1
MLKTAALAAAAALLSLPLAAFAEPGEERIVTLGFDVTELVFALGAGDRVVGVDSSSGYPAEVEKLPKVGYYRKFAAEGVLSLRPTLVVASALAGPPAALDQLRNAGVRVVVVDEVSDLESARHRIGVVAEAIGRAEAGRTLLERLDREVQEAKALGDKVRSFSPRVLFLFSPTPSVLNVGGKETVASEVIAMAGGKLAVDSFQGYRPISTEALVAARPDVLLVTERTLASLGGPDKVWSVPGLALTPAGKAKRMVVVEDTLLLGMGPRIGEAVRQLAQQLLEAREAE